MYVIDRNRKIIRTIATHRHMRTHKRYPDGAFSWDGRENSGTIAPAGTYHFRIDLIQQHRTFVPNAPVTILTERPLPLVTSVLPSMIQRNASMNITINYTGTQDRRGTIVIYRLGRRGPHSVKTFQTKSHATFANWDGLIHRRPAPTGDYLIGLDVTNTACTTAHFPAVLHDAASSARQATLNIR